MYVYNDKTNKVLFESDNHLECVYFIHNNYDETHSDWGHIWIDATKNLNGGLKCKKVNG